MGLQHCQRSVKYRPLTLGNEQLTKGPASFMSLIESREIRLLLEVERNEEIQHSPWWAKRSRKKQHCWSACWDLSDEASGYRSDVSRDFLALNQEKIDPENDLAIENALKSAVLDLPEDGRVIINGIDVSEIIRTPEVSMLASLYASKAPVRQKMVELQQRSPQDRGLLSMAVISVMLYCLMLW